MNGICAATAADVISAPKKPRSPKKRKRRDPNEPQKPVSAYSLFFRNAQAAIKVRNPSATFGDVSKIVASMWDGLDDQVKNFYKRQMEVAKKEYLKQLAVYRATLVAKDAPTQSGTADAELSSPLPASSGSSSVFPQPPSVTSSSNHSSAVDDPSSPGYQKSVPPTQQSNAPPNYAAATVQQTRPESVESPALPPVSQIQPANQMMPVSQQMMNLRHQMSPMYFQSPSVAGQPLVDSTGGLSQSGVSSFASMRNMFAMYNQRLQAGVPVGMSPYEYCDARYFPAGPPMHPQYPPPPSWSSREHQGAPPIMMNGSQANQHCRKSPTAFNFSNESDDDLKLT